MYKPIYDGTPRKERDKNHSHRKWAVHVEAIAGIALTSKAYLKKALLSCSQSLYQPSAPPSSDPSKEHGIKHMGRHKPHDHLSCHSSSIYFQILFLEDFIP